MKRLTRTLRLGLLVLALLAAVSAAPAAAGGKGDHGRPVERPYKPRAISKSGPGTDCTTFVVISTAPIVIECPYGPRVADRVATHLGRHTLTSTGVTRIQILPLETCVDYLGRPGVVSTTILDGVILAPDGSEVFVRNGWTSCFEDGVGGNVSGAFMFTGGTGRFEGASGSGTYESFDPGGDEPGFGTLVGTIIY
jgi:hypothetical protein